MVQFWSKNFDTAYSRFIYILYKKFHFIFLITSYTPYIRVSQFPCTFRPGFQEAKDLQKKKEIEKKKLEKTRTQTLNSKNIR